MKGHSHKTTRGMHSQELRKSHLCVEEMHSDRATASDSNAFVISSCKMANNCGNRKPKCIDEPIHVANGLFGRHAHTTTSPPRIRTSSCTRPPSELHGLHVGRTLPSDPRPAQFSSGSRSTCRPDAPRRLTASTSSSLTRSLSARRPPDPRPPRSSNKLR